MIMMTEIINNASEVGSMGAIISQLRKRNG